MCVFYNYRCDFEGSSCSSGETEEEINQERRLVPQMSGSVCVCDLFLLSIASPPPTLGEAPPLIITDENGIKKKLRKTSLLNCISTLPSILPPSSCGDPPFAV